MVTRRYYSMKINTKVRPAEFEFGAWWKIHNLASFNKTIQMLRNATKRDGIGRVLCYGGKAGYTIEDQRRIYIVKMGHDKKLWETMTPQGQLIKHHFKSAA